MSKLRFSIVIGPQRRVALLAVLCVLCPTPTLGQYIGSAPPPPLPAAPRAGEIETPAASLARAVRILAQSPRDFIALIKAGRAALDLGDSQAAIGFFGRAEELRPSDPAPKIGMGAAAVADGDAAGALRWFYQAAQLGATGAAIGADRGLAQDLLGNQAAAQVDYRAALTGPNADDARRRLALSLGISGDRNGAFATLQPLLLRRDPAAQRIRAFVLALVGDEHGASNAIEQAMPGSGSRMGGFFRLLPSLTAPQKAAAVHLGMFPDPSEIRVAAVSPRVIVLPSVEARRVPQAPTVAGPPPASTPVVKRQPRVIEIESVPRASTSKFDFSRSRRAREQAIAREPQRLMGVTTAVATPSERASIPQPGFATVTPTTPSEVPVPGAGTTEPLALALPSASAPASVVVSSSPAPIDVPAADRLSGIDRLLAQADELPVPPPPRPRLDKASERVAGDSTPLIKANDPKKTQQRKSVAEANSAKEEAKAPARLGLAGSHWVQLAGGAHAERMASEFRRLSAKSAALKNNGGAVTEGKDYFRLLTGPFKSKAESQAFVNRLAKEGIAGFSWNRTPATIRIEKLSPK